MLKKPNKIFLDLDDLKEINELLESGFSFKDTLALLKTVKTSNIIHEMEEKINEGKSLDQFFGGYCKRYIQSYFNSFAKYLPFKQALSITIKVIDHQRKQIHTFIKTLAYPLSMFLLAMIGLYIFNLYFFPSLIKMLKGFQVSSKNYLLLSSVIHGVITFFFLCLLAILIFLIYVVKHKKVVFMYVVLCTYTKNKLLKRYLSNEFVIFFKECLHQGLKSKQALDVLKSCHMKPLLAFQSYHIDKMLLEGFHLQEALSNKFLDQDLSRFMNIAIYSNDIVKMLEGYLLSNSMKLQKSFKHIANTMQIVSYATVILLIIFVFQILLLPLKIMGQIQ